LQRKKY